jgi:hypothetical protein
LRGAFPCLPFPPSPRHASGALEREGADAGHGTEAIERHIARLLPCITQWPHIFASAPHAQSWLASVVDVQDAVFAGVDAARFRGYVTFNTARRAWEGGAFELRDVPAGWVRTPVVNKGTYHAAKDKVRRELTDTPQRHTRRRNPYTQLSSTTWRAWPRSCRPGRRASST